MAFEIRPATEAEAAIMIDWARSEGWNPGKADLGAFLAQDQEGFLMGWLEGRPVAAISVVKYGADFGFLGFYIVAPERRGQGHGMAIWRAGMARLGGRTVGLDGVVAQQANYAKSGFVLAHRNIRYGGEVRCEVPADPRLGGAGDLAGIEALDRGFFAAPRPAFLRAWLRVPGHVVRTLTGDAGLTGYGVLRPCAEGSKIGPLFAANRADAEVLFRALAAEAPPGPVFLDPPEPNGPALRMAEDFGLSPSFETARMYRGPAPKLPLERTFGITTFELG
jgi:hypothetical protein